MTVNDHLIHLENGILHADSPRHKIDEIVIRALAQQETGPLVVHFHGGLISYAKGRGMAAHLLPVYQEAGGFPVFFVWESGLIETIQNNLREIAKEEIFILIWKRVREIIARKLLTIEKSRGIESLPPSEDNSYEQEIDTALAAGDITELMQQDMTGLENFTELSSAEANQLESELGYDYELLAAAKEISDNLYNPDAVEEALNSRSMTIKSSAVTLMDPKALDQFIERSTPSSRGLISSAKIITAVVTIAARVISRFIHKRDHGLHATIVEEILHTLYLANIGGAIWKTMKKDTADSFGPDPQIHGGSAFIDALKSHADPANPPGIILIGHSTGAVYISEFIKNADKLLPADFTFEVIFLAPASTCSLTAKTLTTHQHRISNLRMFTMTDENEKKNQFVPVLYPHSLLYFVSGVVEPEIDMPIVGMERFYDIEKFPENQFPAVATVRNYMKAPGRAVWSVSKGASPGFNTASLTHGGFADDLTTLESIKHIISNGF